MKIHAHGQVRAAADRTSIEINGQTPIIGVLNFK